MASAEPAARAGLTPRESARPSYLGGLVLVLVTLATASAFSEYSPLSPDHIGGRAVWSSVYLGAASGAFVLYLAGLRAIERVRASTGAVLVLVAAIQVVPLAGPVLLSTDAYTYWAYGRLAAVYGENPYRTPPNGRPEDVAFRWMGADWRDTTSVYGPGFTLASEGHALAVGGSPKAAALTYRLIAALCMIAVAVIASRAASRPALAAAFVGWNPLLALHAGGGGHNDFWIAALVLAALWLAGHRQLQLAGVAWAIAIAVKWVPALFLTLRVLRAARSGGHGRHVVGFVLTASVLGGLATWRYGDGWLGWLGPLARNLRGQSRWSIPHRLSQAGLSEDAAALLCASLLAVALVWLGREAWRGRARLGLAAGLVLLATPWLVPWYAAWVVPLAAVEEDRAARGIALGLSGFLLPQAVPF